MRLRKEMQREKLQKIQNHDDDDDVTEEGYDEENGGFEAEEEEKQKQQQQKQQWFKIGDLVEAQTGSLDFQHTWWQARVLGAKKKKIRVEYLDFVEENDDSCLEKETLSYSQVRPVSPDHRKSFFANGARVEVYENHGWWIGYVVRRDTSAPDVFWVYFLAHSCEEPHHVSKIRTALQWDWNRKCWLDFSAGRTILFRSKADHSSSQASKNGHSNTLSRATNSQTPVPRLAEMSIKESRQNFANPGTSRRKLAYSKNYMCSSEGHSDVDSSERSDKDSPNSGRLTLADISSSKPKHKHFKSLISKKENPLARIISGDDKYLPSQSGTSMKRKSSIDDDDYEELPQQHCSKLNAEAGSQKSKFDACKQYHSIIRKIVQSSDEYGDFAGRSSDEHDDFAKQSSSDEHVDSDYLPPRSIRVRENTLSKRRRKSADSTPDQGNSAGTLDHQGDFSLSVFKRSDSVRKQQRNLPRAWKEAIANSELQNNVDALIKRNDKISDVGCSALQICSRRVSGSSKANSEEASRNPLPSGHAEHLNSTANTSDTVTKYFDLITKYSVNSRALVLEVLNSVDDGINDSNSGLAAAATRVSCFAYLSAITAFDGQGNLIKKEDKFSDALRKLLSNGNSAEETMLKELASAFCPT